MAVLRPFSAYAEIGEDLEEVERNLRRVLYTDVPVVTEVTQHPLNGGGKRLRPALCLLGGRFHQPEDKERLVGLATAAELIHMATLVHDDIVDQSATRRGQDTVNARWGDRMAVLTGDFLFARAFTLVAQWANGAALDSLCHCVTEMAKGEMRQFGRIGHFTETEADYIDWIEKKTALFIAESSQLGALACGAPPSVTEPLAGFGRALGLCFQIVDDVLDITSSTERLGKPTGGDLRNGVTTLPLIHALRESADRDRLLDLLSNGHDEETAREVVDILTRSGSLRYASARAADYATVAHQELRKLPDVPARRALAEMAEHLLHRTH